MHMVTVRSSSEGKMENKRKGNRERVMAITTAALTSAKPVAIPFDRKAADSTSVRRRITPQAGHVLEILGHAIEYLTDEYVHNGGQFRAGDPEVEAIQLLMAANRAIYFECPVVPSFGERLLRFFGIRRH
jgi:hypothetical protein